MPPPDRFVGREVELAALNKALDDKKAITITAVKGIGGIGKSTLAKAFAQHDKRFKLKLWAVLGQNTSEDLLPLILCVWTGQDFSPDWSLDKIVAVSREVLTKRA